VSALVEIFSIDHCIQSKGDASSEFMSETQSNLARVINFGLDMKNAVKYHTMHKIEVTLSDEALSNL